MLRQSIVKYQLIKNMENKEVTDFLNLIEKSEYLSKIKRLLWSDFKKIDFNLLMSCNQHRRIILFFSTFLYEYKDYLD